MTRGMFGRSRQLPARGNGPPVAHVESRELRSLAGDRVVARVSARGTHSGPLFGHPLTGKVVTLTGITIYRIVDGRIAERWAEHGLGVLEQLGITPPGPQSTTGEAIPLENPR